MTSGLYTTTMHILAQFGSIDKQVSFWLYHAFPRFWFFDLLAQFFNTLGIPFVFWIAVLSVFRPKQAKWSFVILPLFNFLVSGGITNYILKFIFARPRPCFEDIVINHPCPLDFSFPSSHAATSFAVATSLSYLDPKRMYIYYSIALIISFSRIYLGVHFLFDVLGGVFIGVIVSVLTHKILLYNKTYKNFLRRVYRS